jgi:hypothetical protein
MTTSKPPTLAELRAKRADILAIAADYGAYNLRVFGSVARGTATENSDIDFLVDFQTGATIWDAVALWRALAHLLKHPVNVIAEEPPLDDFMQNALKDAISL